MSFAIADRVRETTSTTGTTSPLNLVGAWPQFQSFVAGVGSGNNCEYTLLSANGSDWEVGIGTVTSGTPNTLSRDTVLASSNVVSGVPQLISLTGTSTVFLTRSAASYRATMGMPIVSPPVAANWTKRFFTGTATLTDTSIGPVLNETVITTDLNEIATIAVPSTPYTIDIQMSFSGCSLGGQETAPIIGWTDGTKLQTIGWAISNATSIPLRIQVNSWTNNTTLSTTVVNYDMFWVATALYGRLADNGTNVTFSVSNDGVNYVQLYTVAKASGFLGSTGYSNIGWGMEVFGGAGANNPPSVYACLKSWWQH